MRKLLAVLAAAGLVSTMTAAAASGVPPERRTRNIADGKVNSPYEASLAAELPEFGQGLPPSRKKMRRIGRLRLTETPGVISDVGYRKGYAYLGEWFAACAEGPGGTYDAEVHVVDVRNPERPRKVATIPNAGNDWTGEGVHVVRVENRRFRGDVLLMSSEPCDSTVDADYGGMTLVDVTDPRNPEILVENFGDHTAGDIADPPEEGRVTPHSVHSVMGWRDGNKTFAMLVDNEEALDVDIADISDPRNPVMIAETGLPEWEEANPQVARGASVFIHDMQIRRIDGRFMAAISYWDLGWVLLDLSDPSNPEFVLDSDYPDPDPLTGFSPPEGNAHQSWWSRDARFMLGTDEDFDPFRLVGTVQGGPFEGDTFAASNGSGTPPVDDENPMVGDTTFVGLACGQTSGDQVPPAPGEGEQIALIERGVCTFTEKVATVTAAGYDGAIVFNNEAPDRCSAVVGMSVEGTIPAVGVGRDTGYKILGIEGYDDEACRTGGDYPGLPEPGTQGHPVDVRGLFDGWGYVHLLDGRTFEEIDAYAVNQALDPRFAEGFGDLTVHEVQTDPRGNYLGYLAYYNAGARVVKFGPNGMREVGHFIARRGNNFWGIEPVKRGKRRPLLLFSDRDYGLYILEYTGKAGQ